MAVSGSTASSVGGVRSVQGATSLPPSPTDRGLTPTGCISAVVTPRSRRSSTVDYPSLAPNQENGLPFFPSAAWSGQGSIPGPSFSPHRPVYVMDPPRVGKVRWKNKTSQPDILTRKGPMTLETFSSRGDFFLLLPPLLPHPGVPLDANGAFDLRTFMLSQGSNAARPLHEATDGDGWGPPMYER
uniref:Uncharacterized protein n=1 Tax=Toxoplasma gondii (strain ATCC 50861 / VEG) TaxID=432359 RepID=A0A0F7V870_TOXGV|nr:TPA: hypothetical protein BN1205_001855 [Toxoplasma gondii VEG]